MFAASFLLKTQIFYIEEMSSLSVDNIKSEIANFWRNYDRHIGPIISNFNI